MYRDSYVSDLTTDRVGQTVTLAGWAGRIRDQGGVAFVDLRDASGIIQVVIAPEEVPELAEVARGLRREYCVKVTGQVRQRPEGTENPDLATGAIEVAATDVVVLSPAQPLPFQLDESVETDELVRLQYRYLDLRRERMAANLRARSKAVAAIHHNLDAAGFLEVETPTLIKSTPEGARDVLVPSRLRQGHFYALPQSPQLFKQLLMVAGVDRYYQIARCYRDEDFRADRQIEFTQLDLEGSFWGQDDVLTTIEGVLSDTVAAVRDHILELPLPRMTYAEAIDRFGSDKPDTRFGMELVDLSDVFVASGFNAFASVVAEGGVVRAINVGATDASRSRLDAVIERAKELGAKGLVWMVAEEEAVLRSPIAKFLEPAETEAIAEALSAQPGDVLLLVADTRHQASSVLGQLRLDFGRPDGHDELRFLWVVDFPVFEPTDGGLVPAHHPFTSPRSVDELRTSPETAIANAYDLVVNGVELGSGSVRIHDPVVQQEVFDILGIAPDDAAQRFGWFLEALRYGTPPHAGFAFGIDRLVSVLQNEPNIREVIPFPKTQSGLDPLTSSPSRVADDQLAELGIELRPAVKQALSEAEDEPPAE